MEKENSVLKRKIHPSHIALTALIYFCAALCVAILLGIIIYVLYKGLPNISLQFLTTSPSVIKETYGILPNIINTLYIIVITIVISTPIGVGAAIYLNEYAKKGRLVSVIEFTIETLAGIPSIIYGLFGYMFFSLFMKMKYSIIAGALTLAIMVLPVIIRTTQESIKSVPKLYREGALGIGATKWYMIKTIVLPSSLPGIITSIILAIGRIVGESAALIFTAGIATTMPKNLFSHIGNSGASLTVQLYQYTLRGENGLAFSIAAVLIVIVLIINLITKYIGKRLDVNRK